MAIGNPGTRLSSARAVFHASTEFPLVGIDAAKAEAAAFLLLAY